MYLPSENDGNIFFGGKIFRHLEILNRNFRLNSNFKSIKYDNITLFLVSIAIFTYIQSQIGCKIEFFTF